MEKEEQVRIKSMLLIKAEAPLPRLLLLLRSVLPGLKKRPGVVDSRKKAQ